MDLWPQRDFDFDRVFSTTANPSGVDPELAKVRDELNQFKTELKPWLQEIGDSKMRKLQSLGEFLTEYVIIDPNGKLNVTEFNPMVFEYIKSKTGLITEITSIKGYMESLYNKSKDDSTFWYKGHRDCFYAGIRWKTQQERANSAKVQISS